jgi:PAS domain S-box-containing protein
LAAQKHTETTQELKRYQMLVESVRDYAIFLLDKDGYVTSWNKGAERLKGYKPKEIIGRHFSTFYTEKDKSAHRPENELKIAARVGRVEDEGWRVRKDGNKFWANVIITALRDHKGKLWGYAKVTRDLTDRKVSEDRLRMAYESLAEQQEELKLLNKSKDEFISLASHQLRTPATGVKQYLGMLLEGYAGELSEQQLDILQKAYDSNTRQLATVNDLLRVAQVDSGKIVLNLRLTNITDLIEDVIDEQADSFKLRKQSVRIQKPTRSAHVNVDAVRLRMALENLIDNASKYTPERGTITIIAKFTKTDLKITIQDTGVGISSKDINGLFTKFFRIPNKLSSAQNGSGLGLYWAKKIAELHNGTLTVESRPGHGSAFTITIPQGLEQ